MVNHCGAGYFAGDDDVHVVPAAHAVVGDRLQKRVGVGRQIDTDDCGLFVDDVVEEAGVLVREAIVILAPDVRTEQIIQRPDRPPLGECRGIPSTIWRAG